MDFLHTKTHPSHKNHPKHTVHHVLAHSYSFYFFLFLLGVFLDLFFPIRIFHSSYMVPLGVLLLILSSILIFWAQRTSRNLGEKGSVTKETFCRGPYCYTRSPTHWGLFLLMLGCGIVINAVFIILFTIISFVITKFVFLKKQEEIMAEKYGTPYLEYKKEVKL
jgi:protein-S-isoprenylcysteine O-methyltransferase Ste14